MKKTRLSFLFSTLILGSISGISVAKAEKCVTFQNSLAKTEAKANERLDAGKTGSARSQLKSYERTLRNYTKAECPDIEKYVEVHAELKQKLDVAGNRQKCEGYRKKLDDFDGDKITEHIENGDSRSASRLVSRYEKELKKYTNASCPNAEEYEKQIASYFAMLNSNKCDDVVRTMAIIEKELNRLTAIKNPEAPRLHRSSIGENSARYSHALDSYKKNQCAESYTIYEDKLSRWGVNKDPYGSYKTALKNNDAIAAELAINSGVDIDSTVEPLEMAIEENATEVVKLLIEKSGVDINQKMGGRHFLNVFVKSDDKTIQLDMVKLLLSLGADIKQSRSEYIVELAAQVGDLDFIKQLKDTPLTAKDYAACYKAIESKNSELESYCVKQVKSNRFGETWADQNEGMKDRSLAQDIQKKGNYLLEQVAKREGNDLAYMERVKIRSEEWTINRSVLGIIESREVTASGFVEGSNGLCYIRGMRVNQRYDGEKYGVIRAELLGRKDIDCD